MLIYALIEKKKKKETKDMAERLNRGCRGYSYKNVFLGNPNGASIVDTHAGIS